MVNYHQQVVHLGEGTRLGEVELVQKSNFGDGDLGCGLNEWAVGAKV